MHSGTNLGLRGSTLPRETAKSGGVAAGARAGGRAAAAAARLRRRPAVRPANAMQEQQQQAAAVDPAAIDLAHRLADAAARVTTRYFRTPTLAVDAKADSSPVTVADREAEAAMRALIRAAFPGHGIFGEEHGLSPGSGAGADWLWVLDPIDGTKSFITGKPLFGTLIALLHRGTPLLGVIDQPVLRERWLGVAGAPTTLNGAPVRARPCEKVGDAYLYATTPHMFAPGATEAAFARLRDAARVPLYGCDCYAYGLLAAGHCDLVAEADLKPYDYMALVPVIQGAGGVVTDWAGGALRWTPDGAGAAALPGEVLAAGDARAHAEALRLLDWANSSKGA